MPTLTQLEYLDAVAKEQHFGRAAKRCHVSQPSLSIQLQKLEEELSVVVFNRSRKPIALTEKGAQILAQARTILKEHRKLYHIAAEASGKPKGRFRLAIIPTVSQYLVPLFLAQFAEKYPEVELMIDETKTRDIIAALRNDQIDAGLLVTPLMEEDIYEKHLYYERFYAYLSPHNPLLAKESLEEFDLEESDVWLLAEGHCFRDQALKVCSGQKSAGRLKNVSFSGGNIETLKKMATRYSGYTLLPELSLMEMSEREKKEQVRRIVNPVPTRQVSLVHQRSFYKNSILEALSAAILDALPASVQRQRGGDTSVVSL